VKTADRNELTMSFPPTYPATSNLPPGYSVIVDQNRTRAVLVYQDRPIPHVFMRDDHPVIGDPEQAAVALAIQAEHQGREFSRYHPNDWTNLASECVAWQREAMRNLAAVSEINPLTRGHVSPLMLESCLRGRLAEYRQTFDSLVHAAFPTNAETIDRAIRLAIETPAGSRTSFRGLGRAWPTDFRQVLASAREIIRVPPIALDARTQPEMPPLFQPRARAAGVGITR